MTYLITFCCYGSRVPGEPGVVNHDYHLVGGPNFPQNTRLAAKVRANMIHEPYILDAVRRQFVLDAILEVCRHRGWSALAIHVRTNHLHIIVNAETTPEFAMNTFKSYATRALKTRDINPDQKRWARHGSTRHLRTREEINDAIGYVLTKQGKPMSLHAA